MIQAEQVPAAAEVQAVQPVKQAEIYWNKIIPVQTLLNAKNPELQVT